jgi:hypothetical protein
VESNRNTTQVDSDHIEIANEFAMIQVRKIHTRNGAQLEISAPKQERRIRLDPLELESLTWQTSETFTSFLSTPFGPEIELE